ncbi:MAG: TIGR02757 family protein [Treponema sp.]|nr:TIGR02757 family protein [Treponema sp.]
MQFPRRYTKRADIEIAAFLAATIAWGRRDLIIRSCEKMFSLLEPGPAAFVMAGNYRKLKDRCVHRTFFEGDLKYFCRGFRHCYAKYGSLEKLFACGAIEGGGDIWQGISLFREEMAAANGGHCSKHIASPGANSACKRINLALRWLVRSGPVDIGLWKNIQPSALYIPLDVHVARNARRLGLLQRKSNDKKAVIELTEKLREFCPEDPVKYDFALFGDTA